MKTVTIPADTTITPIKMNNIISFFILFALIQSLSWCFHYMSNFYLSCAQLACKKQTFVGKNNIANSAIVRFLSIAINNCHFSFADGTDFLSTLWWFGLHHKCISLRAISSRIALCFLEIVLSEACLRVLQIFFSLLCKAIPNRLGGFSCIQLEPLQ